jgi:probable F420-dependent oxidoreductase
VVLPYRNPFVVAKAGATLDLLSEGRFTLAVGAGYLRREFAALGIDYAERNELFDESLSVIRAAWTQDEVTFEGRHFTAIRITAYPRPIGAPHPPIWIGGNAAAARQRVADHGDGWCPFAAPAGLAQGTATVPMDTLSLLANGIADMRRRVERAGRDPATIDITFTNHAGGVPGTATFDAGAHIDSLHRLAELGITWTQVSLPGDDLTHTLDAIDAYKELVIDAWSASR